MYCWVYSPLDLLYLWCRWWSHSDDAVQRANAAACVSHGNVIVLLRTQRPVLHAEQMISVRSMISVCQDVLNTYQWDRPRCPSWLRIYRVAWVWQWCQAAWSVYGRCVRCLVAQDDGNPWIMYDVQLVAVLNVWIIYWTNLNQMSDQRKMEVALEWQAYSMIQLFKMPFELIPGGHHHFDDALGMKQTHMNIYVSFKMCDFPIPFSRMPLVSWACANSAPIALIQQHTT